MFKVKNNKIYLVRGDTFRATVNMKLGSEAYVPQEGDYIRFALKKNYSDATPLLVKEIPNDTLILELAPEDTKPLAFGSYHYDIEITFANGDVDTFIRETFTLLEEVL